MAPVVLSGIRKRYANGFEAVRGVDLDIADEELLVLVGPSGCGKTTTLRMIAGLEDISEGTIHIGDRLVNHIAPKDRDIAMVFQNYALYPHMTVYKNLAFALRLRRMPKAQIEERVQWAARTLGLEEILYRRPGQLSGGQRQRVAVGRAIVREPQVFLFDEPLSNLDARLRVSTRGELKQLQQSLKTTTVYVTHDQEEAMTLGDRVVVMNHGVIHQVGTPWEVYRQPADRFVAGFVGMPPMNLLDGTLEENQDALVFTSGSFAVPLSGRHASRLRETPQHHATVGFGVRPESLTVAEDEASTVAHAKVEVVEILGAQMDVHVTLPDGQRWICRGPTGKVDVGSTIPLALDVEGVHVFAANGENSWGANLTAVADPH